MGKKGEGHRPSPGREGRSECRFILMIFCLATGRGLYARAWDIVAVDMLRCDARREADECLHSSCINGKPAQQNTAIN